MRVGIISFEESLTRRTLRGVSTATRYLKSNLENLGVTTDLIVYGRGKLSYPAGFDIVQQYKNPEELKGLKNIYDFIVYFTPGRSWEKYDEKDPHRYDRVLDAVGIPFTFIYHSEEYKEHQPYRMSFLHHKDCKFLTFVTDLRSIYEDDLKIVPRYTIMMALPPLNDINYITGLKKTNSIIMTSVWTNFKRNLEYFQLTSNFNELGIHPYSAGAPNSNYYMNDICDLVISRVEVHTKEGEFCDADTVSKYRDYQSMMTRINQDSPYEYKKGEESKIPLIIGATIYDKEGNSWYDYGSYFPEDMHGILEDKKFHWNMSGYKVSHKLFIPRLETVTLEAFNEGCLPVLCSETSPSWIEGTESAFRFSQKDYRNRLEELASLSESDRICRLTNFYETVKANLYDSMYEKFISMMEE